MPKTAVIVGAGPAGLAAAYELLERTDVVPVVLEASELMGGIARTVEYHGNRIDIGGHRFFSKSDRVMEWWLRFLPLQRLPEGQARIAYQNRWRTVDGNGAGPDPEREDRVMLLRPRKSRIYHRRKLFEYPISLTPDTLLKLGLLRSARIGLSYLRAAAFPIEPEENLEHFFVNRFGRELYLTFFKDYTEKVWGTPCNEISAAWGAQRVKGLSIAKALAHFAKSALRGVTGGGKKDIAQKGTETSLIEQFLYPKLGPGQMWDEVAAAVRAKGGRVLTGWRAEGIETAGEHVVTVTARNLATGASERFAGDWFFSTMPIRELVRALDVPPPPAIASIAEGLLYRDFVTVGLLLDRLLLTEPDGSPVRDNWIYIQEPDVLVGRLQIFNNWSPWMVADPGKVWVGLEYFCDEGDALWSRSDADLIELAKTELARIRIADPAAVRDGTVLRMPKTYPAYFGSYDRFDELRSWLDRFDNLFLVGRNGMHRYNNQDHSILAAMTAVDNILAGRADKSNLWAVNTEEEYHEEK
ncbi:MAG TPA: NAD(P)/FAD-dependent oxidoreductase [Thermoanaerobaculia bacterium]|jgi:protoporphyrinogen oxidase|nr:NAD(P)/FAD-dependent oxidoreductase [Thermoanaerobaculia bacterium]